MASDPLEHLLRLALPWRRGERLTECGLDADLYPTLTLDEMQAKVKTQGKQRASLSSCMTCWTTGERWASSRYTPNRVLRVDLVEVMAREMERCRYSQDSRRSTLAVELEAIAALVEAHRDEFDGYLTDHAATVSLDDLRAERVRRGRPA